MQMSDSFDSLTVDGSQQNRPSSFIMVPHLHMNIELTHINSTQNIRRRGRKASQKVFSFCKNCDFIYTERVYFR
jgi:hypothetical protein